MAGALVALGLSAGGGESDPLFTENLREQMVLVSRKADAFQLMLEEMASVDRVQLETTVAEAAEEIEATRVVMETAPEDEPELAGPLAILGEALNAWEAGVIGFEDVVLTAADSALVPVVDLELGLTDSLVDLRAGDRVYASFVRSFGELEDVPPPVVPFPEVVFVPVEYPLAARSAVIISTARAAGNDIELRAELAIDQVATVPEMVVNTNDERVVTETDRLMVRVVVVNRGNTESEPRDLTMLLTNLDGTEITETQTVAQLTAGSPTTVEFADLPVVPGAQYSLRVQLQLSPGEEESEDNVRSFEFRVNEETEGSESEE